MSPPCSSLLSLGLTLCFLCAWYAWQGGEDWTRVQQFYSDMYTVTGMDESAKRIACTLRASSGGRPVVVVAHNGPSGLGDQRHDICGRDWRTHGGGRAATGPAHACAACMWLLMDSPLQAMLHLKAVKPSFAMLWATQLLQMQEQEFHVRSYSLPDLTSWAALLSQHNSLQYSQLICLLALHHAQPKRLMCACRPWRP